MKFCRVSKRIVPDGASVCPFHHGTKCLGTVGGPRPALADGPPPSPADNPDEASLRYELGGLENRIRSGRRAGRRLVLGAFVAVAIGSVCWAVAYAREVRAHAEVGDLTIARDPIDPSRVALLYRAVTAGRVGICRSDADRETELIDRAAAGAEQHKVEWRWAGLHEGDVVRVKYRQGWSLVTRELAVPSTPPAPPLGSAVLTGRVVDATTSKPLSGAQVHVVGTDLRATTALDGTFRLTGAPEGPVGVKVSAPQFCTLEVEKVLRPETEERLDAALSPGLARGQLRIVLTWGNKPADLDAHLEGPLPGDKRFHIFFGDQGDLTSREYVSLDIDCQKGNGPETITVLGVQPGVYHYFVHDFTNQQDFQSDALSRSSAKVEVYQGGQMLRRFAPKAGMKGNIWHVCDVEVTADQKARVVPLDTYESKHLELKVTQTCLFILENSDKLTARQLDRLKAVATNILLSQLRFDRGLKVGLVTFDATGIRTTAPTADRYALRDTLTAIGPSAKTSFAKGLESAFHTLSAVRGQRLLIVLTPGLPDDRQAIDHWSNRLKKIGVEILVFGIGDADVKFLKELASDPRKYQLIRGE